MQVFADLGLLGPLAFKAGTVANAAVALGLVMDVPFEFVVGTYTFPAGKYRFEAMRSTTRGVSVLAVRGTDGRVFRLAVNGPTYSSHKQSRSKLIFQRRHERCFLTEAWFDGRCLDLELYRSLQDLDTERESAETDLILLVEPDDTGRSVYVIEDQGCTA